MIKSVTLRRMIAWIIDWNLSLFPPLVACMVLAHFLNEESVLYYLIAFLCLLLILSGFAVFVLRDLIFKGRSLGKRIFELYVYEKNSLKQATKKQLLVRNIFFFLYLVDVIVLISTGETIGDRVAGTVVLLNENFELEKTEKTASKTKRVILKVMVIVIALTAFFGLVQVILNNQKDTEEYKIAYNYFVESESFKNLNADETEIRLNTYSLKSEANEKTVEITFSVGFKTFKVVCHNTDNQWQVCNECTQF